MVLGAKMVAVVCMRVLARSSLASRAVPSAWPIMRLMLASPGLGMLKAQLELVALVDLSGEGWCQAEVGVVGDGLYAVNVVEEVVLGDGWGLFGLLGAVGGGAPQVQGGVQGSDLLDPLPHAPAFRDRVTKSPPPHV